MLEEFSEGWHQPVSPSEARPKPDGRRRRACNSASLSLAALKVTMVHPRRFKQSPGLIPNLFSVRGKVNVSKD